MARDSKNVLARSALLLARQTPPAAGGRRLGRTRRGQQESARSPVCGRAPYMFMARHCRSYRIHLPALLIPLPGHWPMTVLPCKSLLLGHVPPLSIDCRCLDPVERSNRSVGRWCMALAWRPLVETTQPKSSCSTTDDGAFSIAPGQWTIVLARWRQIHASSKVPFSFQRCVDLHCTSWT